MSTAKIDNNTIPQKRVFRVTPVNIVWHFNAWEDYLYWQKNDKKLMQKINELIKKIAREPFSGTGKPEALKYALKGYWSRRINQEHRLVYKVTGNNLYIAQCRYHYLR